MTTTDPRATTGPAGAAAHDPLHSEQVLELEVAERTDVADGVVSLVLRAPDGGDLPPWAPGAHVDLELRPDLVRQYSLSGSPQDRSGWRLGVLRDQSSRGGSQHVHDVLQPGVRVAVRGPRNHFPLEPAPGYVFVAGGIGITPLLPMVAQAEAQGADWTLWYGGRSRASMAFTDELAAYGDRVRLWPEDERGLLDLDLVLGDPVPGTLVYTCGPEGLLHAVETRCAPWPPGSLRVERFSPKPQDLPDVERSFEVVCQKSGVTVTVPPDRTILEAVSQAGVTALSSCQEGVCGTCETAVLEGVPDHRDSLLSEEERAENEFMMICVSRSCGDRLVLDL